MTALHQARPAGRGHEPCGRCRGGGWPGSSGGSTASRWSAWPRCSARRRCYLWIVGSTLHSAYAAAVACHPVGSPACQDAVNTFNGLDNFLSNGIILQVFPVLIGAFIGAPLLAREMETGTFRYAWTQGFGRWRWTLAKLVALGAGGDGGRRAVQPGAGLVLPAVLRHGQLRPRPLTS